MTRLLLIGLTSLSLMGCGTSYVELRVPDEVLGVCLGAPEGKVGELNESLVEALLVTRESLRVCKGIARSQLSNGDTYE